MGRFVKCLRHVPSSAALGLARGFGERRAASAVGLTVNRGEVLGFVGLAGAGKTTF